MLLHAPHQVINQVAAASLGATLNCDAFADAHSSDSHYDRECALSPCRTVLCSHRASVVNRRVVCRSCLETERRELLLRCALSPRGPFGGVGAISDALRVCLLAEIYSTGRAK